MKLWVARFIMDTGVSYQQHELIISAPNSAEAREQVYAWDYKNSGYDEAIDYSTLTIDEIDISKTGVLKTFDRGVI